MEISIMNAFNVFNKQLRLKKYQFIKDEGPNILFLLSFARQKTEFQDFAKIVLLDVEMDPVLWIAINDFNIPNTSLIKTYENEFPRLVLSKNLMIATRVLIAEGLASWVHFADLTKFNSIIEIGLKRFYQIKITKLKIKNTKLKKHSEFLIYFVTHIILLATFYGRRKYEFQQNIVLLLQDWRKQLFPIAKQNLEIWLEISICLLILGFKDELSTIDLFNPNIRSNNPHLLYHTYALWAMYFNQLQLE